MEGKMSQGYASHLTLLAAAFTKTTGPVLELGAGLGSTLMLHGLCGATGRKLKTLESNKQWFNELRPEYQNDWHEFKYVDNFIYDNDKDYKKLIVNGTVINRNVDMQEYCEDWGLAFVDHGIISERRHSVEMLYHVPMVVVHDTCHPKLYHYDEAFKHYKHRFDLKLFGPHTSVLSNIIDVEDVFGGVGL